MNRHKLFRIDLISVKIWVRANHLSNIKQKIFFLHFISASQKSASFQVQSILYIDGLQKNESRASSSF